MVRQSFNFKIKRKKVEVIDICITLPIVLILAAIYAIKVKVCISLPHFMQWIKAKNLYIIPGASNLVGRLVLNEFRLIVRSKVKHILSCWERGI